jgi:hypothetical protein
LHCWPSPGFVKTNIHAAMGITFEEYCRRLGNPKFITAEELADIICSAGTCCSESVSATSW